MKRQWISHCKEILQFLKAKMMTLNHFMRRPLRRSAKWLCWLRILITQNQDCQFCIAVQQVWLCSAEDIERENS